MVAAEALSLVFFSLCSEGLSSMCTAGCLPYTLCNFAKFLRNLIFIKKKWGLIRFKYSFHVPTYQRECREATQTRCDELGGGRLFGQSIQEYTIDEERLEFGLPTTNKLPFCDSFIYSPRPYTGNINRQVREVEETMVHFNPAYWE